MGRKWQSQSVIVRTQTHTALPGKTRRGTYKYHREFFEKQSHNTEHLWNVIMHGKYKKENIKNFLFIFDI